MPDVRVNPQEIKVAGLTPSYTGTLSVSDTYVIANDGRVFVHFKKSGAGNCTVTVDTPGQVEGLDVAQRTFVVVATTGDVMAGPFSPKNYNTAGDLRITVSEITGLTIAAIRLP